MNRLITTLMTNFKFLSIFIFSLSVQVAFSQAELVADINEGEGDSGTFCYTGFTDDQSCSVHLDNKILFYAEEATYGRELYVLQDGVTELLIDLNGDSTSSDPRSLTVFNEHAYFLADDNTGYKVWRTDGTTAGTEIAFDLGVDDATRADYTLFQINDEKLFFVFQGSVYVFDGVNLTELTYDYDIVVSNVSFANSFSWSKYKNGIAIMAYNGQSWDMLQIQDETIDVLFNFSASNSFRTPYAISPFEGGISFSFDAAFDEALEGRYLFLESDGSVEKQSDVFTTRSAQLNESSSLVYSNDVFILYDESNPSGKNIAFSTLSLTQGENWNRFNQEDYFIFQSSGGVFEDDKVSILNKEAGSSSTIYSGDELTRIYEFNNEVFFFAESEVFFSGHTLYKYSIDEDELTILHEIPDLPFNSDLYPLGVQGEYLYFFGNVVDSIGIELYRLSIDAPINTQEFQKNIELSFDQIGTNSFITKTDIIGEFNVEIYNAAGQLIKSQKTSNHTVIDVPYVGIVYIKASHDDGVDTHVKFVSQ